MSRRVVGTAGEDVWCQRDGRRHGPSTSWSDGARLVDGGFRDDHQDGLWTWYHPDGTVQSQAPWREQLAEDGSVVGEYTMDHGTGIEREWWRPGVLKLERTFDAGRTRAMIMWYADGQLARELVYSADGDSVDREDVYRDGVVVETIDYRARREALGPGSAPP